MAEYDFRSETTFPKIKTIDCTENYATVIVPSQVGRVQIGCQNHAIYVNTEASEGDAGSITNSIFVPSGNLYTQRIGRGSSRNNTFYVALQSAGTKKVSIALEEL
jgi:hypothetical protein